MWDWLDRWDLTEPDEFEEKKKVMREEGYVLVR